MIELPNAITSDEIEQCIAILAQLNRYGSNLISQKKANQSG
jgi:hypothetical protein